MSDLEILENIGTDAVKRLRKKKLTAGKPFMINSKDLPAKQSYLEFPDATIKLVEMANDAHSFVILKELSLTQANSVRQKYSLL